MKGVGIMLTKLYVLASSVYTADPYPARCDLYKAFNPIIGWFIGEAKGVLPSLAFGLLFGLAIAAIVMSKRIQKNSLRWATIIIAILLGVLSLWDFLQAVSPSPCLGQ
jgi:uncharacterized membrane protein YfcA